MRGSLSRLLLATLVIAAVALPTAAAGGSILYKTQGTLFANMDGDQVLPPPGDPDGTGTALLPTNARDFEICYDIDTENLELPLDAGIVYEKQGEFGQVVIELFQNSMDPDPGGPGVCLTVTGAAGKDALRDMVNNPEDYFLQISDSDNGDGAIRGDLRRL
jgi:hypothetical protein